MISREALKAYLEKGTIPRGPLTVHIDITNRCNLNCVTCWNYSPYIQKSNSSEWKQQELAFVDFQKIIGELQSLGVKKLILSGGGEPFTHPAIYDMIELARTAGFDVTVITNGVLIDSQRLLGSSYLANKLLVNLCAATAETYATFHPNRSPADFHSLCGKLKEINQEIPLNLAMVISNVNQHEIRGMARLAAGFRRARLSYKLASLTADTARFALNEEQKMILLEREIPLCQELCEYHGVEHNLDVFASQLRGEAMEYPIEETGCYAGLFYSRIYTTGDVFFCCSHIKVGNIFEQPFSQVWRNEKYDQVRQRLAGKKFFPACKTCGKYNLNFEARQVVYSLCQEARDLEPGD